MSISFRCGFCLGVLSAREEIAGRAIRCPKCQALLEVPAAQSPIEQQMPVEEVEPPDETAGIPRVQAQRMPPVKMELAGEDDEIEDQPRRKSSSSLKRSSTKGSRKFRKKPRESRVLPLLIVVGILVALTAGGFVLWMLRAPNALPTKPPPGWKEFHGEGFTCFIPETSGFARLPDEAPQFRKLGPTSVMYTSKAPNQYSVFSVILSDAELAALRLNAADFRKRSTEKFQSGLGGRLVTGRSVEVDGYPGYEVEGQRPEGTFLLRVTFKDNMAIMQILTLPDLGSFDDPRARPFFESFHITN